MKGRPLGNSLGNIDATWNYPGNVSWYAKVYLEKKHETFPQFLQHDRLVDHKSSSQFDCIICLESKWINMVSISTLCIIHATEQHHPRRRRNLFVTPAPFSSQLFNDVHRSEFEFSSKHCWPPRSFRVEKVLKGLTPSGGNSWMCFHQSCTTPWCLLHLRSSIFYDSV